MSDPFDTTQADDSRRHGRRASRRLSAVWTALLVPFLFLPYRWLWLPCAVAATVIMLPSRRGRTQVFYSNATLIFGPVLLLIIRTALDLGWWLPWLAVMGLWVWLRGRPWWSRKTGAAAVPLVWASAFVLLARPDLARLWNEPTGLIRSEAVLVCAGDSLTSGVDLRSDAQTYVARLRSHLPCTVINAGVGGNRAADLLKRIERDVLSQRPAAVLVFIGGNDYLDGTPRGQLAAALDAIVARIVGTGARVVLVEVPSGIIWNPYAGVIRDVANKYGAVLVPESWLRWWFSIELVARDRLAEPLTLDGIHLSPAGATKVANWLEPYLRRALAAPR